MGAGGSGLFLLKLRTRTRPVSRPDLFLIVKVEPGMSLDTRVWNMVTVTMTVDVGGHIYLDKAYDLVSPVPPRLAVVIKDLQPEPNDAVLF